MQICNSDVIPGNCPPKDGYLPGLCSNSSPTAETGSFSCKKPMSKNLSAMKYSNTKITRGPSLSRIYSSLTLIPKNRGLSAAKAITPKPLPSSWSWKTNGGNKISPVANQCQCGCCWAVAATTALADRFGVQHDIGAPDLSAAWTVMKIGPAHGGGAAKCQCKNGGSLAQAGCGFQETGVALNSCYPFGGPESDSFGYICQDNVRNPPLLNINEVRPCCGEKEQSILFHIVPGSTKIILVCDKDGTNVDQNATHKMLKAEIANNGPIATTYIEYNDFNTYWNSSSGPASNSVSWNQVGVYTPKSSYEKQKDNGGHAVVITGWGVQSGGPDDGVHYWEVRNSWGVQGAGRGYFKYAIIENDPCYFAVPGIVHIDGNTEPLLAGGAMAFMAGYIPSGFKTTKGTGTRRSPDYYGDWSNDRSTNWTFIILILLLLALVLVSLVILFKKKRFRTW